METLLICVFNVYIGYVIHRRGILPSISDSWYELPGMEKHLFTIFIIGIAIPMAEIAIERDNWWFFASAAVLCLVGIATEFKKKSVEPVHIVGAIGGMGLGVAGMVKEEHYILTTLVLATITSIECTGMKNRTWWVEIVCFYFIWISLKVPPSWFTSFYIW